MVPAQNSAVWTVLPNGASGSPSRWASSLAVVYNLVSFSTSRQVPFTLTLAEASWSDVFMFPQKSMHYPALGLSAIRVPLLEAPGSRLPMASSRAPLKRILSEAHTDAGPHSTAPSLSNHLHPLLLLNTSSATWCNSHSIVCLFPSAFKTPSEMEICSMADPQGLDP